MPSAQQWHKMRKSLLIDTSVLHNNYLLLVEDYIASFQGVVTGIGENSEFGEVFKMMKAEEVSPLKA